MSNDGLSQKATLALTDLETNGGMLSPEQNTTFIRNLLDAPTMLRDVRTITMNTPTQKINKIGFGSRILFAARSGDDRFWWTGSGPTQTNTAPSGRGEHDARAPTEAERSSPTTSQIEMTTKEIIAEVRIPYETLEDNIERQGLEGTILAMIAERAALDLEELILLGDTTNSDDYLALHDGYLKRVSTNVVDHSGQTINAAVFSSTLKALATRYRRNKNLMRFYTSMDVEQDYRLALTSRGTSLGDDILTGGRGVPVFGVPMRGVALMPNANMLFVNPKNLIFGIQRNIRIEQERLISEREIKIVLTCRVALQIEEEPACVKVTNIGEA